MPGAGWRAFATHWGSAMNSEISDGLKDLIDGGAAPVTLAEIDRMATARAARAPIRHRARRARLAAIVAGTVAVAAAVTIAATLVIGSSASPGQHRPALIVTAAVLRHVSAESRAALATDGRAEISYRDTQDGDLQDYGTDVYTFANNNWNDAMTQVEPVGDRGWGTWFGIYRVVNGQVYYYARAHGNTWAWYRHIDSSVQATAGVPDPRRALRALEPSARFEVVGYQVIGGVRLEELRATAPANVPCSQVLSTMQFERVTELEVWVDGQGVVRQMTASMVGLADVAVPAPTSPPRVPRHQARPRVETLGTTLTISFLDIGQPQVIPAPPHPIPAVGVGMVMSPLR